jgi:hypothetical protein
MGLLSGIDKRIGDLLSDVNKSAAARLEIAGPVVGRVTFAPFRLKPAATTGRRHHDGPLPRPEAATARRHDCALLCYC